MACPANGIFIVLGEMNMVMTAMKRSNRWSHIPQEEEQDSLLRNFVTLKEALNILQNFQDLDPIVYLTPFLAVIRSENTSGVVTGHGLSAVQKFLSYNLIDPKRRSAAAAAENIADAVTHARFMMVDSSSDEIVLMKIVQVLRTLLLSPLGTLLTNDSICEIIQSFFRICFETRFSEILRKTSESAVVDTVQLLFSCLPQFKEDNRCTIRKLKMQCTGVKMEQNSHRSEMGETSSTSDNDIEQGIEKDIVCSTAEIPANKKVISKASARKDSPVFDSTELNNELPDFKHTICIDIDESSNQNDIPLDNGTEEISIQQDHDDYVNPRGVRFTPEQVPQEGVNPLMPYGLPCVRELFRLLISLINPFDRRNSEVTVQIGLNLLVVAFETGADNFGKFSSLLSLIKDEMCRNLFSLLSNERLIIFATTLRVFFLLFESLRTYLKFQLEMFLNNLLDIIMSEGSKYSHEQREISLDCLIQLWRIPGFVTELYVNYDCDLYCSNLFEHLTKQLSKNAFPISGLYSINLLSLDSLLVIIDNIESHCQSRMLNKNLQSNSHTSTVIRFSPSQAVSIAQQGFSGYQFAQYLLVNKSVVGDLNFLKKTNEETVTIQPNRMKISSDMPSHEELMAIKHKKKILVSGSEQFNTQPIKGITFLQEHGLLKKPIDSEETAMLLKNNPLLDKKMIGEYISNRKNLKVLECFVKSFTFKDTRIDEALRQYLETFRLPGEAPLISLIMEHFSEHWHTSNNLPFANSDAAFTLAYAIIMLNVDQHNHNVKKQNIPMTIMEFKKNLKNVNGGEDFDENMLEKIYTSIRNEEIVMPAEQTGLVKENYMWKVLLRRGNSKDGVFIHTPNGLFDHDLFFLIWGPTVAALSYIYDKTDVSNTMEKALTGFHKCALIAAHYGMSDVFDNLIISLCKFTTLVNSSELPRVLPIVFGNNPKAQMALKAVFKLAHCHGDILREGWKNLLDCIAHLFKAKLLPPTLVEVEDFLSPSGVVSLIHDDMPSMPQTESSLFSSFYSYITSDSLAQRSLSQEDEIAKRLAIECVKECNCDRLFEESKFLRIDSLQELVKTVIFLCPSPEPGSSTSSTFDEDSSVFMMELLIKIVLLNRDRIMSIWSGIQEHMFSIVMNSSLTDSGYLLERTVVGILRVAVRLSCKEEVIPQVFQSLKVLLHLKSSSVLMFTSRQISYALNELLKTNASNIHDREQWSIVFSLLERVGAGVKSASSVTAVSTSSSCDEKKVSSLQSVYSKIAQSDSELSIGKHTDDSGFINERGYTSDSELYEHAGVASSTEFLNSHKEQITDIKRHETNENIVLPPSECSLILQQELSTHDSLAFLKCCESLAFLVRDAAHITAENFEYCIHCLRCFVEASFSGGHCIEKKPLKQKLNKTKRSKDRSSTGRKKEDRGRKSHAHLLKSEGYEADDEAKNSELASSYQQTSIQLLDLMHTLHTRASRIFLDEFGSEDCKFELESMGLWKRCWCPLLQGIARLCCDNRHDIRTSALSVLQRALLVHDLQTLSPSEWEACFNKVLFPLLAKLLDNISPEDRYGMEETRTRGANLLCKVFLQHLTPLVSLTTFIALWVTILDFMEKFMKADSAGSLAEAIPESLKNMLLVMDTAGVFQTVDRDHEDHLWNITWNRINVFLPGLKNELFRPQNTLTATPSFTNDGNVISSPTVSLCDKKNSLTGNLFSTDPNAASPGKLQENNPVVSATVSLILHPPNVPFVSTAIMAPTDSVLPIPPVKEADASEVSLPVLLSPSVLEKSNLPVNNQVPPGDSTESPVYLSKTPNM